MSDDVVRDDQIRLLALVAQAPTNIGAEELNDRRDAPFDGRLGDVGGRLDTEHLDALGLEVLQQVAVVAGQLHHQ